MNILCHVGPWCVSQYRAIAHSVQSNAKVFVMSGFKDIDETGFQKKYYQNVKAQKVEMFGLNEDDFILRCRLLRSLPRDEAILHLYSTRDAVSRVLDDIIPELVISEVVDQFLIDVLRYECEERGIPFYGLVVSFVNGYFRITGRGEKQLLRKNISEQEVDFVLKKLNKDDYAPAFVTNNKLNGNKAIQVFLRLAKSNLKVPYFYLKRFLSGEKYNYHYWASYLSAKETFHLMPKINLGGSVSSLKRNPGDQQRIYVPLQMYPEATIEYWCSDLSVIDYEKTLVELLEKLSEGFQIIVKEHPNVLGLRNPRLYEQLNNIDNVFICNTYENSNALVETSDAVLVWTGSVGFEAALRGKAVLTISEPYYMSGSRFKKIKLDTDLLEIKSHIEKVNSEENDARLMVNELLEGLAIGRYKNDFSWSSTSEVDVKDAHIIGKVIASNYKG